jgi:hypothetical protein
MYRKYGIMYYKIKNLVLTEICSSEVILVSRRRKKVPGAVGITTPNSKGTWWSDSQRIQAVTTWLATGNLALTAATLQIPEVTMRRWKSADWWKQMVSDIRSEENLQLDSKLAKVVNKSVDALLDRVEHGDFQYDQREGKFVRKPISARDASTVTRDMIDRRELLQGKKVVEKNESRKMDEKLVKLAEEFARFAKSVTIEQTTEGTI